MTPLHQCRTKLIEELIQPSDSEAFWSSSKGNATKKKKKRMIDLIAYRLWITQ